MAPAKHGPDPVDADGSFSQIVWTDSEGGAWGIRGNWVLIDGRPECVGLQIWRGAEQANERPSAYYLLRGHHVSPITATGIARMPIATIIDQLRSAARKHWRENADAWAQILGADDPRAEHWSVFEEPLRHGPGAPRRYDRAHFVEVAWAYLKAWRDGSENPTRDVATLFGVPRSTAAKWIARCRSEELQLLSAGTPGKPGAEPGPKLTGEREPRRK